MADLEPVSFVPVFLFLRGHVHELIGGPWKYLFKCSKFRCRRKRTGEFNGLDLSCNQNVVRSPGKACVAAFGDGQGLYTAILALGRIILFHGWPRSTPAALPEVVRQLRAAGAEFVRLDELDALPSQHGAAPTEATTSE